MTLDLERIKEHLASDSREDFSRWRNDTVAALVAEVERLQAVVHTQGKRNLELAGSVREQMLPFIEIAQAEMRERCAQVAERLRDSYKRAADAPSDPDYSREANEEAKLEFQARYFAARDIAAAIRALE